MFWGTGIHVGAPVTEPCENPLHLTNAVLVVAGKNVLGKTATLKCKAGDATQVVLGVFRAGTVDNLQLDLVFEQGKPIEFTVEGDNAATVFLSGYYVTGFAQKEKAEEDEDDEMEEDSETSSVLKALLSKEEEDEEEDEDDDFNPDDEEEPDPSDFIIPKDGEDDEEEEEEGAENESENREESQPKEENNASEEKPAKEENGKTTVFLLPTHFTKINLRRKMKKQRRKRLRKKENKLRKQAAREKEKESTVGQKRPASEVSVQQPPSKKQKNFYSSRLPSPVVQQKTKGGVIFEDLNIGTGNLAKWGKKVSVDYIGKLANGKIFDQSRDPFTFRLGRGDVISGWEVGISGMRVGGKRKLIIPPQMAYGAAGAPPDIPKNATLHFEVKLVNA